MFLFHQFNKKFGDYIFAKFIEASIVGAYIHGMAADLAMNKESQESLISSDIISYFGKAFKTLH